MRRVISMVLCFGILLNAFCILIQTNVYAESIVLDEEIFPGFESMQREFADNRVMVVLSNEASLRFEKYDLSDFVEVGCVEVRELTQTMTQKMQKQVKAVETQMGDGKNEVYEEIMQRITSFNRVFCVKLSEPGKGNVLNAAKQLQKREDVLYAGPDYLIKIDSVTPNDAFYENDFQWATTACNIDKAWDISTGSENVVVGILDTGIDAGHPDLSGRLDFYLNRDFTLGMEVHVIATDPFGHGTHVAGIIGATTNNNVGVAGVCWNIKLASLRVFDETGSGYSSNVMAAIDYAEKEGIPVLNLSAGWYAGNPKYDVVLDEVIENYSGLFVHSAGNKAVDIGDVAHFPNDKGYNTICVGASTKQGQKAYFSNYGKYEVDVFAPGVDIVSCYPTQLCESNQCDLRSHMQNGYHTLSGTSMAAPYVTALAALLLSVDTNQTAMQLKQKILNNCKTYSSLGNYCISGGVIDAYSTLLHMNVPISAGIDSNIIAALSPGESRWFLFVAPSSGTYYFYTQGDMDTFGKVFNEEKMLGSNDNFSEIENNKNFMIGKYLLAGEKVYIQVKAYDDSYGVFRFKVSNVMPQ